MIRTTHSTPFRFGMSTGLILLVVLTVLTGLAGLAGCGASGGSTTGNPQLPTQVSIDIR